MSEELLHYYNRELAYLRRQGAEFARSYPKVAGHLRISEEAVEDPHVSRLLEGVAFMTAQIRQRLDSHFPELTDILMGNLYPDYQAPIPSMSVLQLTPARAQTHCAPLQPDQAFETRVEHMPNCRFQALGKHWIAPLQVTQGCFRNSPFEAPRPPAVASAQGLIRLRLEGPISLQETNVPSLRFYLHGQNQQSQELYDLIMRKALGFALVPANDSRDLRFFPASQIGPLGFSRQEAMVPYSQRSFEGYRLLVEYFLFPEKFLFLELHGLEGQWPDSDAVDLYIYLETGSGNQEKNFVPDHMRLWCLPVVNLFQDTLEPVSADGSQHEYRLVPRYQNADAQEVVALDQVSLVNSGRSRELPPYYGLGHPRWQDDVGLYWHSQRRDSQWAGGQQEPGTETWLSLVDRRFSRHSTQALPREDTLLIRARCCNRNVPARLPFGGGAPRIQAINEPLIEQARALVAPTATVRPALGDASRWQFVRHLSLSHFAGDDACERLRAVLHLHDFRQTAESQALIDGIDQVQITPAVARVGEGVRRGLCHGSEICIHFSRPRYAGTSIYLFSAVLDRFFAQFARMNSFTRLRICLSGQNQDYHLWPARMGEGELL